MSSSDPTIRLLLTPRFGVSQAIAALRVVLTIESVEVDEASVLVKSSTTINQSFIPRQLDACDDTGPLPLQTKISNLDSSVSWLVSRRTSGIIVIKYLTLPVPLEKAKSVSKTTGLYTDHGGLICSGLSFVPVPEHGSKYRNVVEWDLSQAPRGTRAIWTFGEGPSAVARDGSSSILTESVYMVGPVRSTVASESYGYYWFGDLAPHLAAIKDIHHEFFIKVSEFFEATITSDHPYRSFLLNTGDIKSFQGTSFLHSHIFAYDNQISEANDYDLVRRMAYEASHTYLGPPVTINGIDWLYEGIKTCLSVYMPFRNGFRSGEYFQDTINTLCLRYYTSPLINVPFEELIKLVPRDSYAREQLESRAWAFVVGTDLQARRVSRLKRPIEDLAIKPLAKLKANNEPHGIEQWMQLLKPVMGDELKQRYADYLTGHTILLLATLYGAPTHYLKQVDQEILDFGMDRKSFEYGVVMGLKIGSRAAEAGLKEGDKIIWSSHEWKCVDHFDAEMEMIVRRNEEEEMGLKYWPRSYEKAKSWQMVKKDEDLANAMPK